MKKLAVGLSLGLVSLTFATEARAAWGVKELELAAQAGNVAFEEKFGPELVKNITGFAIDRSTQGNSAKATVKYVDAAGKATTVSFFCHNHGQDIDCH